MGFTHSLIPPPPLPSVHPPLQCLLLPDPYRFYLIYQMGSPTQLPLLLLPSHVSCPVNLQNMVFYSPLFCPTSPPIMCNVMDHEKRSFWVLGGGPGKDCLFEGFLLSKRGHGCQKKLCRKCEKGKKKGKKAKK